MGWYEMKSLCNIVFSPGRRQLSSADSLVRASQMYLVVGCLILLDPQIRRGTRAPSISTRVLEDGYL